MIIEMRTYRTKPVVEGPEDLFRPSQIDAVTFPVRSSSSRRAPARPQPYNRPLLN